MIDLVGFYIIFDKHENMDTDMNNDYSHAINASHKLKWFYSMT